MYSTAGQIEQRSDEAEQEAKSAAYKELIGKSFWYKPGDFKSPLHRIFLKATVGHQDKVQYSDEIFPTALSRFEIVECRQLGKNKIGEASYTYTIRFDDGKLAFMPSTLRDDMFHVVSTDVGHAREDSASSYSETRIFTEHPEVIVARHDKSKMEAATRAANEQAVLLKAGADAEAKRKSLAAANARKGGVRLGMSKKQVLSSSWGKPFDINRTISASGTVEQWIYGSGSYLYFHDGILTTIQN